MRSSFDAGGAASAPVAGRGCVTAPGAAPVRGYYCDKTAAIIDRYGPGPRVHYHLGLFDRSRLARGGTAEQVRAEIVVAQERLLERASAIWRADTVFAGNLLDVGCGLGGGAIYWTQRFPVQVTAVTNVAEHAEVTCGLAAAAGVAGRVHPLVADATQLRSDRHYGAAVALESVCYMPRPLLFQQVAAMLVPGGVFGVEDVFLARPAWRAAFDAYWKTTIGTVPQYQQAAAQAGLALEQDLDITVDTSEFWRFSIAWARAKMAEPTISTTDKTRLACSISWHRLFLRGWREGAYRMHILRFRKHLARPAAARPYGAGLMRQWQRMVELSRYRLAQGRHDSEYRRDDITWC
jgi:tocopherol O-methyltransferase